MGLSGFMRKKLIYQELFEFLGKFLSHKIFFEDLIRKKI